MLVSLMENYVEDVRLCAVWQIYTDNMTLQLFMFDVVYNNKTNPGHSSLFSWEIVRVDTIQSLVWMLLFLI